jgi:hypothetical protein
MSATDQGAEEQIMTDPVTPEPAEPAASAYAPPPSAVRPSPVLSIIAMIAGILGLALGLFGWGLLFSIGGVVLGHLGQRKEREAKGFWLTGLITGYIGVVLNLVVIVIWIVVFIAAINAGEGYYMP